MRKDKVIQKIEDKFAGQLDQLENELMKFVELVQSTKGYFDLNFLRVRKKNNKAYFEYLSIVKEFPLEYIEQAKNGNL